MFPCFPATTGHSDSPPLISQDSVAFTPEYHLCAPCSLPASSAPRAAGPGLFIVASLTTHHSVEKMGPPKFLGNPYARMPRSPTPVDPSSQAITALRCCLPLCRRRRLPQFFDFGALSRGLHAPCLRFAAGVTPALRKTRFRLLASFAGGDWLLPGSLYEVSAMSYHPPRPSFAWRTHISNGSHEICVVKERHI